MAVIRMHRLHRPSPVTVRLIAVQSPSVSATTAVLSRAVAGGYQQLGGYVACNLKLTRAFCLARTRLHLLAPAVALAVSSSLCCSSRSTICPLL
jgi:hypothetical protein